jgi:7-cyano-7-deazaguanine reductase
MLADIVKAAKPLSAELEGDFTPRGGVYTKITASWKRKNAG